MTAIVWDAPGTRKFETGVDRGVLYDSGGQNGVPWLGLISVEESIEREVQAKHIDGVKYLEYQTAGDYAGTLNAYTYPDVFDEYNGVTQLGTLGLHVHEQPPTTFCLAYRTKLGNDIAGVDLGYRIHMLYSLSASPDPITHSTLGSEVSPTEFSWSLSGIPQTVPGAKPSAHISVDSTKIDPFKLEVLEDILYGTESVAPSLPSPTDIYNLVNDDYIFIVKDNGDGTWTGWAHEDHITMISATEFEISDVDGVFLDANTYQVSTTPF